MKLIDIWLAGNVFPHHLLLEYKNRMQHMAPNSESLIFPEFPSPRVVEQWLTLHMNFNRCRCELYEWSDGIHDKSDPSNTSSCRP